MACDRQMNLESFQRQQTYLLMAIVQALPSFLLPLQMPKSADVPILSIWVAEYILNENPRPCQICDEIDQHTS